MPLSWIVLVLIGALLGWLTAVVLRSQSGREVVGLVVIGSLGALFGAFQITPALAGKLEPTGFSLPGVLLSLLGTFLMLGIVAAAARLSRNRRPR